MPLVFVNGQAPDYSGFIFTTSTGVIDKVQETLVAAGWTTYYKAPDGLSLTMVGTTAAGVHTCSMEFNVGTYGSVTNGKYLNLRAWHEPTKVTGSPINIHRLIFVEGKINRLWLTADQDSGCISIWGAEGSMTGWHFGFLDRIDTTDQWAWMIGQLATSSYPTAYVAKSKHANTNWYRLSNDFGSGTSANSAEFNSDYATYPQTTLDFTMRGQWYENSLTYGDTRNAFFNPWQGRLNYNGQAIIDPYCYMEGRGSMAAYTVGSYLPLYYRGYVKNAYCGVASLPAAAQLVDAATGYRILSVGGAWWQGMRIL
jgi:hypothetical protein